MGLDNGYEENYGNIFFLQLFGMTCKLPVPALNKLKTCDPSRIDYSTFLTLFLTTSFIVSNWWPISEWIRSKISAAAIQRGRSCYF